MFCFARNKPGRRRRRRRRRTRQEEPLTWARALEQLGRKTLEALFTGDVFPELSTPTHTPQIHCFLQIPTNYNKIIKLLLLLLKTCWRQSVLKEKATEFCQVQSSTKSTPKKKSPNSSYKNIQSLANSKLCMGEYYGTLLLCWVHKKETHFATNHLEKERERERERERGRKFLAPPGAKTRA